jgi:hypothetical protein
MNALLLALAMLLLTAPPDKFEIPNQPDLHQTLGPSLTALCLEWELLDPRETNLFFTSSDNFATDLEQLRDRYRNLHNAPPASDGDRFPDSELVNDMLTFNRNYRDSVNDRLHIDMVHIDELNTILVETDQLHQVYDTLCQARTAYHLVSYRRQALAQLRDLVGVEAYYTGQLPPHVPLWRIPEAR